MRDALEAGWHAAGLGSHLLSRAAAGARKKALGMPALPMHSDIGVMLNTAFEKCVDLSCLSYQQLPDRHLP